MSSKPTIYTSCFSRAKLIHPPLRAVSIARWPPRGWPGGDARYNSLAPPADLLRQIKADTIPWKKYCTQFNAQLATLDPTTVVRELEDNAVLLCFCEPGADCHRRLVAAWLERKLGIMVPEWEPLPSRALTVKQPWASEIIAGTKTIEYRSWPTTHRGPLFIHAAARRYPDNPDLPLSAILGIVEIVDCIKVDDHEFEWVLASPRPLAEPLPMKGALQLWTPRLPPGWSPRFAAVPAPQEENWEAACDHCHHVQPIPPPPGTVICVKCRKRFIVEV